MLADMMALTNSACSLALSRSDLRVLGLLLRAGLIVLALLL